jgi:hypothetical protein
MEMSEEKGKRKREENIEEIREFFSLFSKEAPGLIKAIIGTVFSEEAGKDMGKAAGAFYKELKDAGLPEETAVKMTENYMATFTSLGDLLRGVGKRGNIVISSEGDKEIGEEISRKIKEKLAEKRRQEE